jgi:predicted negative regulator of RcsB-dependent stress response
MSNAEKYRHVVEQIAHMLMNQDNPTHASLAVMGAAIGVVEKFNGKAAARQLLRAMADADDVEPRP